MGKTGEKPEAPPFEAAKPEERLPILKSAIARKARLQCWSPGRKHSYVSRVMKAAEEDGVLSIAVSKAFPGGDAFEASIVQEARGEILFSLHLPTDVIFFKGEHRVEDRDVFVVRIAQPIFKVQRREALRLPVPGSPPVTVTLPDGHRYAAELLNISEGGIGVLFRDKAAFDAVSSAKGAFDIAFTAFGTAAVAKAVAKHGAEVGSALVKKSFRLGMAYREINPKLRAELSQLVLEESAKYLGRF